MLLIGATSGKPPAIAYQVLVALYAYNIVLLVGFFVACGLLYARYFGDNGEWKSMAGFKPLGGPTAAICYALICGFLLVASWVPPSNGSPYLTQVRWFIVPTVGLSILLLGYIYYLVLVHVIPRTIKKGKQLVATRNAVIVRQDDEYVQYLEIVDAAWVATEGAARHDDMNPTMVTVV